MLMTHKQSAELTKPRVGTLHDPAASVAAHLAPVFIAPPLVVLAVGRNQLNGPLLQSLTQRVGVVASVGDYAFRFLPRSALRPRDADFFKRGFRKRNFCRRGTFQPNSQRKTLTVDQYHPLRPLAALGFTDRIAPFLAGAKLPSRNVSSHFSKPSASNAPNRARHASSHTPSSCHCFSRRQQVAGEGYSSGRNRHAAPVAESTECPQNKPDSMPTAVPGCPSCVVVPAIMVRLTPTVHPSTASAASS
jgi:hypothetical protein